MSCWRRVWLLLLLACWSIVAWAQEPYRFLVMGDPQFRVARPGDSAQVVINGYRWTSPVWAGMPQISQKVGARFLFVCGDIFEYKDGDGSTIDGLWDQWDQYTRLFPRASGGTRIEWTTGGHEFWGGGQDYDYAAKDIFLKRYPEHMRYAVHDGDNLFILFNDIHDPTLLDNWGTAGLDWLKATLESSQARRIFFFGHVPPRNTTAWWPDGTDTKADNYRAQMAELLTKHHATAAFFGHEHFPSYLGDAGGFPMFVTAFNTPLLVEIQNDHVTYRWLKAPLAEDPLAQTADANVDRPVQTWHVAAVPPGLKLVDPPGQIDPAKPLRLNDGSEVPFEELSTRSGDIALPRVSGARAGGQIVAIAEVPRENYWAQHFRVRSGLPGAVYFNALPLGRIAANPQRWNTWHVRADRSHPNRATLVLDVVDINARFALVPHTGP